VQNAIAENRKFADNEAAKKMLQKMDEPPAGAAGPVAQLQRDMANGKLKETAKDLEDLAKQFENMDKADQEKAAQQMEKLAAALQQMAEDPKAMDKLKDE